MTACVGRLYKLSPDNYSRATALRIQIESNFAYITSFVKDWDMQVQLKRAKRDLNTKRAKNDNSIGFLCFNRSDTSTAIGIQDDIPVAISIDAIEVISMAAELVTRSTWNITGKRYTVDNMEICVGHCDRNHGAAALLMEIKYYGIENSSVVEARIEKMVNAVAEGVNIQNMWMRCGERSLESQWRAFLQEIS